ncbi:hypothetical protein C8R45DRAFT_941884 [Mycena sanguinolenta]|nr:hypothetical protein C8R45DRAFT_941884 [Mycena sanguinolenta]
MAKTGEKIKRNYSPWTCNFPRRSSVLCRACSSRAIVVSMGPMDQYEKLNAERNQRSRIEKNAHLSGSAWYAACAMWQRVLWVASEQTQVWKRRGFTAPGSCTCARISRNHFFNDERTGGFYCPSISRRLLFTGINVDRVKCCIEDAFGFERSNKYGHRLDPRIYTDLPGTFSGKANFGSTLQLLNTLLSAQLCRVTESHSVGMWRPRPKTNLGPTENLRRNRFSDWPNLNFDSHYWIKPAFSLLSGSLEISINPWKICAFNGQWLTLHSTAVNLTQTLECKIRQSLPRTLGLNPTPFAVARHKYGCGVGFAVYNRLGFLSTWLQTALKSASRLALRILPAVYALEYLRFDFILT